MKSNTTTRIIIRADGDSEIGLGHIYRSLALVEMLKDKFNCLFFCRRPDSNLSSLIETYCSLVVLSATSWSEECEEMQEQLFPTDIVVLDGYHFDRNYQKFLKTRVNKIVMIDDMADKYYIADIVINQGGTLIKDRYQKESYTKLLIGLEYLLVRNEFLTSAQTQRKVSRVGKVFICMGGADPNNITIKVLQASCECSFVTDIVVVTGSAFRQKAQLESVIRLNNGSKAIKYEDNITAKRMIEVINDSEIAVCPSSSIALEVCCVKAGLLTGIVFENQRNIHSQLVERGCCISLQDFNSVSVDEIVRYLHNLSEVDVVNKMMQYQSVAIDGFSGERVLNEFNALANAEL